jgi:hypothetical protein
VRNALLALSHPAQKRLVPYVHLDDHLWPSAVQPEVPFAYQEPANEPAL